MEDKGIEVNISWSGQIFKIVVDPEDDVQTLKRSIAVETGEPRDFLRYTKFALFLHLLESNRT